MTATFKLPELPVKPAQITGKQFNYFQEEMDESPDYDDSCLIDNLILLRKEVPSKISEIYDRITVHLLKNLKSVNIQLENKEISCEIPYNLFEELNRAHYDVKLHRQIQLLHILMKMKNSPISKIIDEIR